jgi:hypothetical protein
MARDGVPGRGRFEGLAMNGVDAACEPGSRHKNSKRRVTKASEKPTVRLAEV